MALTDGHAALEQVDIKLFVPLLPMLSELSRSFDAILKAHPWKHGAGIQVRRCPSANFIKRASAPVSGVGA